MISRQTYLAFQTVAVGFPYPHPVRSHVSPRCNHETTLVSRRTVLRTAATIPVAISGLLSRPPANSAPSKSDNGGLTKLERAVVPIVMCRTILIPVRRYIEEGEWDKSRTNINYCTRVLALKKNIRESAEYLEGDAFYDALDIAGELDNIMTQLDATVYTPLFIPSDEGVSVEQRKYQRQAFSYYDTVIGYFDTLFTKIPEENLARARAAAKNAKYQINFQIQ